MMRMSVQSQWQKTRGVHSLIRSITRREHPDTCTHSCTRSGTHTRQTATKFLAPVLSYYWSTEDGIDFQVSLFRGLVFVGPNRYGSCPSIVCWPHLHFDWLCRFHPVGPYSRPITHHSVHMTWSDCAGLDAQAIAVCLLVWVNRY